jgi:hypothetical protein
MEEKNEYVQKLSVLPLRGSVNLKNPEVSIWTAFHYFRPDDEQRQQQPLSLKEGDSVENHHLKKVYLGRLVGQGGMREVREPFLSPKCQC